MQDSFNTTNPGNWNIDALYQQILENDDKLSEVNDFVENTLKGAESSLSNRDLRVLSEKYGELISRIKAVKHPTGMIDRLKSFASSKLNITDQFKRAEDLQSRLSRQEREKTKDIEALRLQEKETLTPEEEKQLFDLLKEKMDRAIPTERTLSLLTTHLNKDLDREGAIKALTQFPQLFTGLRHDYQIAKDLIREVFKQNRDILNYASIDLNAIPEIPQEIKDSFTKLKTTSTIKPATLFKAIESAFYMTPAEKNISLLKLDGHLLVAVKDEDVHLYKATAKIGKGTLQEITDLEDLQGPDDVVMKKAKPRKTEAAQKTVKQSPEKAIIDKIHSRLQSKGFKPIGIPDAHKFVDLASEKKGELVRQPDQSDLFDSGELFSKSTLDKDQQIELAYYLTSAVESLSQADIIHSNINEENFSVRKETDGTYTLTLSGFGRALDTQGELGAFSSTPPNTNKEELRVYLTQRGLDRARAIQAGKKNDVFALATTLYLLLEQKYPFELDDKDFPILTSLTIKPGEDPLYDVLYKMLKGTVTASQAKAELAALRNPGIRSMFSML